ncbi:MAG: hypothetical protein FJW20_18730 [Acidimicrobiia bacterium]|nr:hypothetical protein [Acidimicrobiia bacterium]
MVVDPDAGLPGQVIGDPRGVRQVLTNLLSNAVKFTDSGHVRIQARLLDEAREGLVRIEFAVEDTGIGIATEHQDLVFEMFRQADASFSRRHDGAGIGLTVCKMLVEIMGGQIGFTSQPGKGSRFHFLLTFRTASSA